MKALYCSKIDPSSECDYVVRGKTEEEVLQKARAHAIKEHGEMPTAEMMEEIKVYIEEE